MPNSRQERAFSLKRDPQQALGTIPPFRHTRTDRGLIAWAPFPDRSTSQRPDELELRMALTRWFGQPS